MFDTPKNKFLLLTNYTNLMVILFEINYYF